MLLYYKYKSRHIFLESAHGVMLIGSCYYTKIVIDIIQTLFSLAQTHLRTLTGV